MRNMAEIEALSRANKEKMAQSLFNLHFKQQEAKQTAAVVNAGGLLGRLAYFASH